MKRIEETYFKMLEGDLDATIQYAELVAAQGEIQEAYNAINKLSDEDFGDNCEALKRKYELIGAILTKMRKYEEAATAFENVTELGETDNLEAMAECYAYLGRDLIYIETLARDDDAELLYTIACAYAGKYNAHMRNPVRAKLYFERIKDNNPENKLLLAKCDSWLAYVTHGDKTDISEEYINEIMKGRDRGDEECIILCKEFEEKVKQNKKKVDPSLKTKENKSHMEKKANTKLFSKKIYLVVIAVILLAVIVGVAISAEQKKEAAAAQQAVIENKKEEIKAIAGNVLGGWYECDVEREGARKLLLEVDAEGNCVFKIASESGSFTYSEHQVKLDYETREGEIILNYGEDKDGNVCLNAEESNISFYRNKDIIESQKFATILKEELPGEWEDEFLPYILRINSNGTYEYEIADVASSGNWVIKVTENKVKLEFLDMEIWNSVYEKFNEVEQNSIEWEKIAYEDAIKDLKAKEESLAIDYHFFRLNY